MSGVDISQFKKVHEDEHSATLAHPKGHHIRIAKRALSPKMSKQLSELPHFADGGAVPDVLNPPVQSTPSDIGDALAQEAKAAPVRDEYKYFLNKEMSADNPQLNAVYGSPDVRAQQALDRYDNALANPMGTSPAFMAQVRGDQGMMGSSPMAGPQMGPDRPMLASNNPADAMNLASPGSAQASPELQPKPAQAQPMGAGAMPGIPSLNQAIQEGRSGIFGEAKALGQEGKQKAAAADQFVTDMKDFQSKADQNFQNFQTEYSALKKDVMDGHVDPKHFMNNMGTVQKVSTAIGLILGGMGSGLTGGENPALKFLNSQIDRDIDAQKTDLGKKQNLLSMNMQMFGHQQAALAATKASMSGIYAAQLEKAAAQSQDPLAKSRALQAASHFDIQARQLGLQASMMQAAMGGGPGGQGNGEGGQPGASRRLQMTRFFDPAMAKDMEARIIPHLDTMANRPVSEENLNKMIAYEDLQKSFQNALQFSKQNAGSLSPSIRAQGKTMALQLQDKMRRATGAGVYKESENEFMTQSMGGDLTGFFSKYDTRPKIKELLNEKNAEYNNMLRGYGIHRPQIQEGKPNL